MVHAISAMALERLPFLLLPTLAARAMVTLAATLAAVRIHGDWTLADVQAMLTRTLKLESENVNFVYAVYEVGF